MSTENLFPSSLYAAVVERLVRRPCDLLEHGRHFAIVEVVASTRRVQTFAFAGLLALLGASTATAQTYVENGIQGAGKHHVIITIIPGHENDVIDTLRKHGNRVRSQHPSINGVAADINGTDVADLAKHGAVTITRDHTVTLSAARKKAVSPLPTVASTSIDPNAPQTNPAVSTLRLTLG